MSDITGYQSGDVNDSGKVNWRGDQATAPVGQSIYKTSSVPLAELGARVVVGDRVFRYALAGGAIGAGDVAQGVVDSRILVTAGGTDPAGGYIFTWYAATSQVADYWAEGTIMAQSGTAANLGYAYRVKSHALIPTTTNGALTLYDPLVKANNVADKWSIFTNPYKNVTECTAGTAPAVGVAPILVTSGDYFWAQTWGPAAVKSVAGAAGEAAFASATGQVTKVETTSAAADLLFSVGQFLQPVATASQYALVFLTIAP